MFVVSTVVRLRFKIYIDKTITLKHTSIYVQCRSNSVDQIKELNCPSDDIYYATLYVIWWLNTVKYIFS